MTLTHKQPNSNVPWLYGTCDFVFSHIFVLNYSLFLVHTCYLIINDVTQQISTRHVVIFERYEFSLQVSFPSA